MCRRLTGNAGRFLPGHVVANPVTTDVVPADNKAFLAQTVTGSYDPNDKQESHEGILTYSQLQKGEYLNYTIYFQNTGNDLAYKIVILYTLDGQPNHSSVQMLAASHPYSLRILNNSIPEFCITWFLCHIKRVVRFLLFPILSIVLHLRFYHHD